MPPSIRIWAAPLPALSLLASGCTKPHSLYAEGAPIPAPPADIDVLEADVLVVDGQHLRLVDLVAPQPTPRAHCVAEALAARQARLRLRALSQGVQHVTITPAGAADDYGRTPIHVLFDGHDPGQMLIEEGLAVAPGSTSLDWCAPLSEDPARTRHIAMLSLSGD